MIQHEPLFSQKVQVSQPVTDPKKKPYIYSLADPRFVVVKKTTH